MTTTRTIPAPDALDHVFRLSDHISDPAFQGFLEDLRQVPDQRRVCTPGTLPVLAHFDAAIRAAPPAGRALLQHLQTIQETLFWGQTYAADDFGPDFLLSYGWTEFVGLRGPISSEKLACGVLFLGPDTEYPMHAHEAQEIYVPLSGTALWKKGESPWLERAPLEVVHHQSWTPHAMRTIKEPLITLFFWRGGDLRQKSRIGPANGQNT